jgi:hypothetical protein
VCTECEWLKFKVPVFFLSTVGFSLRRDGRYLSRPTITSYGAKKIVNLRLEQVNSSCYYILYKFLLY